MNDNDDKTIFISPKKMAASVDSAAANTNTTEMSSDTDTLSYFGRNYQDNKLLYDAQKLISVIQSVRFMAELNDVREFHQKVVAEMKHVDEAWRAEGQSEEIALSARYMLCAALDEAAINTPWGINANWGQHSLLRLFHNESSGGEKFFLILEKLLRNPGKYIDLIELGYVLISLGFEGKYRVRTSGQADLGQIRASLFNVIQQYRAEEDRKLCSLSGVVPVQAERLKTVIPVWVIMAAFLAVMVAFYAWYQYSLSTQSDESYRAIDEITYELQHSAAGR